MYYSILREGRCGVSALLLEESIDTGPVLARRHYPQPPPDVDSDYLYDSAIRCDLLIRVLQSWHNNGGDFPNRDPQPKKGTDYYIIHPVLKHLAIQRVKEGPAS